MKKLVFALTLLALTLVCTGAMARTLRSGDFEYALLDDGGAELIRYHGAEGRVIIPNELDGHPITAVRGNPFVITDKNRKTIGVKNCSVSVASNHPYLATINGVLFGTTDFKLIYCPPRKGFVPYEIPKGIRLIGDYAFYRCTGLTLITIPDSVTTIGEKAFMDCADLASITIPDSVSGIGNYALCNCAKLTSVSISNRITRIGDAMFSGCTSLTAMTIPAGVTRIGRDAFHDCVGLTAVHISSPEAWLSISYGNEFANPLLYAGHLYLNDTEMHAFGIPDGITTIEDYAFAGWTGLLNIAIPDSINRIGNYAFWGCTRLYAVHISSLEAWLSVSFGNEFANPLLYSGHLYLNNTEMNAVTIPDGITTIEDYAFAGCASMTSVTIPDSITHIGNYAFWGCVSLKAVYINKVESWLNISINNVYASPLLYAGHLYLNGSELTSISIPDGMTAIKNFTFAGWASLTSVTIPSSVTSIGKWAFYYCIGLNSVAIPTGVTRIGEYAFYCCTGLSSVAVPVTVKSIGSHAFDGFDDDKYYPLPDLLFSVVPGSWAETWCTKNDRQCIQADTVLTDRIDWLPTE